MLLATRSLAVHDAAAAGPPAIPAASCSADFSGLQAVSSSAATGTAGSNAARSPNYAVKVFKKSMQVSGFADRHMSGSMAPSPGV